MLVPGLDTFGSDHAPHTLDEKGRDYWSAPSGLPGVGTMFPLILGALKNGRLGLELMVSMCSENPARIFGIRSWLIDDSTCGSSC